MDGLGERIKLARGPLSQEELASKLDVDRSTVGAWEINRRLPDIPKLSKLAKVLGVSIDWLADNNNTLTVEQDQAYRDSKWREIIDIARTYNIQPDKLKLLIKAALAIKA